MRAEHFKQLVWLSPGAAASQMQLRPVHTTSLSPTTGHLFCVLYTRTHRDTASPLAGRPSRGSTITRQQRAKSTRPPRPCTRTGSTGGQPMPTCNAMCDASAFAGKPRHNAHFKAQQKSCAPQHACAPAAGLACGPL